MEKWKNLNDLQLSIIVGMILFTIVNLSQEITYVAPLYLWITATILSALFHILLTFCVIKIMKTVIKHLV